jgi:hypothetical protein
VGHGIGEPEFVDDLEDEILGRVGGLAHALPHPRTMVGELRIDRPGAPIGLAAAGADGSA